MTEETKPYNPLRGTFGWMLEHARRIRDVKGPEYTLGLDPLHNFDVCASSLNTTPELILSVYAYKHWAAIMSYCAHPEKKTSEPIEDRIADMINYLLLLYKMTDRRRPQP